MHPSIAQGKPRKLKKSDSWAAKKDFWTYPCLLRLYLEGLVVFRVGVLNCLGLKCPTLKRAKKVGSSICAYRLSSICGLSSVWVAVEAVVLLLAAVWVEDWVSQSPCGNPEEKAWFMDWEAQQSVLFVGVVLGVLVTSGDWSCQTTYALWVEWISVGEFVAAKWSGGEVIA